MQLLASRCSSAGWNAPAAARACRSTAVAAIQRTAGSLTWNGKLGGSAARPGSYVLWAAAQDTAGNLAKPAAFAVVQVRYVVLARSRIVVKPGAKFALLPPDNATGNFTKVVQRVPVRIAVTEGCGPNRPLRPGMSVVAHVVIK